MIASSESKLILCLINSAAYSRSYFEQLAPHLRTLGYRVHFALDSHFSDHLHGAGRTLDCADYFTDYLRANPEPVAESVRAATTWQSLFSDFDRWLTFNLDAPSQASGRFQYQDIPARLDAFFGDIFERLSPSAVLYEPVSNSFALAAYRATQLRGVPFLSISPSRIPGRIELSTSGALKDFAAIEAVQARHARDGIPAEILEEAIAYLASIDQQVPDYMKTNGLDQMSLRKKYLRLDKLSYFLRIWRYSRTQRSDWALAYQHGDPVALSVAYVRRAIWRKLRLRAVRKLFETQLPTEDFLVYPLHFHPEASTSIHAGDYVDELSVIKAVAFRLPSNVKLYVKEHPSAVALQPLGFYKQLSRLPNVRLISPELNAKALIRKSRGVVTLTSTAGFEGAVLNKPVLAFGNVFYRYFPNVRTVDGFSDIGAKLSWLLGYQPVSNTAIVHATAAYLDFTVPGKFDFMATLNNAAAMGGVARLVHTRLSYHDTTPTC